jgi:hypothetical protein
MKNPVYEEIQARKVKPWSRLGGQMREIADANRKMNFRKGMCTADG